MLDRFRNNSLIENIFSLSILNGLNLILPLVTIPYLVATVGSAHYGIYSIVYSIVQYALLVSNYGFSYTSTKQIAQNRENIDTISWIFSSTILAKIILSTISIIVCAGIVYFSSLIICLYTCLDWALSLVILSILYGFFKEWRI